MKKHFTLAFLIIFVSRVYSQGLSLPYSTGFDNTAELAGWQQYRTGFAATYDWSIGGGGFSLPNALSHDYNVGDSDNNTVIDWYVSPALNLSLASQISLKISTGGFSTPFEDNCEIWYGTGNQDPAIGNFVMFTNLSYVAPDFTWIDTTTQIPIQVENVYIAFKYKTIGAAWSTYAIDNVLIEASTGLTEVKEETRVRCFPNPSSDLLQLQFENQHSNRKVVLRNVFGQEVGSIQNAIGRNYQFDTSILGSGTYILSVIEDGSVIKSERIEVMN